MPTGKLDDKGQIIMRRVQRSTGTTDRGRALQIAISFERAAVAASEKRWLENSGRKFLAELHALVGVSVGEAEAAAPFLRRWIAGRKPTLSPATMLKYSDALRDFIAFVGEASVFADITPKRVAAFRDAEIASGKSAGTVNKSLMVLRQAFNEAKAQGMFSENPAIGLNVRGEKKTQQKRSPFTFDQFREMVRVTAPGFISPHKQSWKNLPLSPDWQTLVMLCGYTAGRQQEAAKLDWEQVEFDAARLRLSRRKTDDVHWVPLHPSLAAHLRARWDAAGNPASGPVLPYLSTIQRRTISNEFRRSILPRLGIVQAFASGNGKGRRVAAYSLHSLRHSLSTWLAEAGVEEAMRMKLIGHENEDINRGYTHTELAQAAAALGKVPAL